MDNFYTPPRRRLQENEIKDLSEEESESSEDNSEHELAQESKGENPAEENRHFSRRLDFGELEQYRVDEIGNEFDDLNLADLEANQPLDEGEDEELPPFGEQILRYALSNQNPYLTANRFTLPWNEEEEIMDSSPIQASRQQYDELLHGGKCFDFIEMEDVNILEYLHAEQNDNVVFLTPPPKTRADTKDNSDNDDTVTLGEMAVCYSRSLLKTTLEDLTSIVLPCVGPSTQKYRFPADATFRFIRIPLPLPFQNVYIPEIELLRIVNKESVWWVYQILPTKFELAFTASADTVINLRGESGDSCQEGTAKTIYHLRPVSVYRSNSSQSISLSLPSSDDDSPSLRSDSESNS